MTSRKIFSFILAVFFFIFFPLRLCLAANPPASQQMSGEERARQMQEESEEMRRLIGEPLPLKKAPEKAPAEIPEAPHAPKMIVTKINVTGVTLFTADKIKSITSQYENKELTLKEIQKIADLITDLYRKNGFITSRAYVPAQKIAQGVLEIIVIEGKVGDIQIKGNRFFSSRLIRSHVTLNKGVIFNYKDLKKDLQNINDHPDRDVKAVLAPGKEPGSTDIILDVNDSLPVHVSVGYDDFLSYFLRRSELTTTFTDNNILGKDDILTFQYNRGNGNDYYYSGRYLYPVTGLLDLGFFYSRSNIVLGRGLTTVGSMGESKMYSLYGDQKLVKNDNLDLDLTFGFDYKDVDNFLQGALSSRDNMRVPRAGLNFDAADDFGRTIISDEADFGVPGIMGGTRQDLSPTDTPTSRAGADGKFFLDTLNLLRLQRLPLDATLLWKNQLQFTSSVLTATEQFQAGGPANNRGFSPADTVGDQGYAMSWEIAIPPYFIPRYYQLPYFKTSAYDALRFIGFYDWTNVHLNALQPGQRKDTTLSSAGCGLRVYLGKNFYLSYEIGWPIHGSPTDGKSVHQWIQFTFTF